MKWYGAVETWLHALLTVAVDKDKWCHPRYWCIGGCANLRASLDVVTKRTIPASSENRTPVVQSLFWLSYAIFWCCICVCVCVLWYWNSESTKFFIFSKCCAYTPLCIHPGDYPGALQGVACNQVVQQTVANLQPKENSVQDIYLSS
jgi:hypothetical protein